MKQAVAMWIVLVGVLAATPLLAADRPPTEDAIKESIEKAFTQTYVDPVVWKITKIKGPKNN